MPILKRFDPDTASDSYFKARHTYLNLRREEEMPEDPPRSLEFSITNAKSWKLFEKLELQVWHLWERDAIIAELFAEVAFYDDNRHLLGFELEILAPYRRKGYSKLLLVKLVEMAETHNRTLFIAGTSSRTPAGELFAERLGATKGLEAHTNQLILAEVDKTLLETWIANAKTTAKDFELGFWGDTYPEEEIHSIANLINVMNTAPRGDLDLEDEQAKPEDLREREAYSKARNVERWVLYMRHTSGELAGFTETFWDPENPENLTQGNTGVLPHYRGHSLGKWLKSAMIQKVLAERPVAKRVRTGNADSNTAMLAINHALGFKSYIAETVWQIEVEKIKAYLDNTSSPQTGT
jgi:mycothiol synthase